MRITTSMITNRYLQDSTNNLNTLQTITGQLTSGKEVRKPSDNPYKASRSMQLNTDINTNTQYNTNISDTTNWLETTDQYLGQASNSLSRIRTLMVSAGNAAYGSDERKAICDEVNQRIEEFGQILNSNFDGKYVFGGTKTDSTPVAISTDASGNKNISYANRNGAAIVLPPTVGSDDEKDYAMLGSDLTTEVSQGVTINYNVNARDVLEFTDTSTTPSTNINVCDLLSKITSDLSGSGTTADITNSDLDKMDKVLANVQSLRSEVGSKQNRMESAESINEDANYNMTSILSKTQDIDVTEKTIEYSTAQTIYQATLQVSAKVLPKSLLDYL